MHCRATKSTATCTRICMIFLCIFIVGSCICVIRGWSTWYEMTHIVHIARSGPSSNNGATVSVHQRKCIPSLIDTAEEIVQKRYMLALHYAEQLTMSSMHFQAVLNLAYSMNMTGVEPLIQNSRMFSIRGRNSTGNWSEYHTIFNVSTMNEELINCLIDSQKKYPESLSVCRIVIDSNQAFFDRSYRNIILVHVVNPRKGIAPLARFGVPRKTWISRNRNILKARPELGTNTSIVDCTQQARVNGIASHAERLLNWELSNRSSCGAQCQQFTVIQAFCLSMSHSESVLLTPDILRSTLLKFQRSHNSSIVFWLWQGGRTVNSFLNPAAHFARTLGHCKVRPLPHSDQVKNTAAKLLVANRLQDKRFVSVHIRLERLFEFEGFSSWTVCCMNRLKKLIDLVKVRHHLTHTLVITDYSGRYGSSSCRYGGNMNAKHELCERAGRKALSILLNGNASNITVPQANTAEYGAPYHSGFVSRVEAESLVAGQVLITVGSGSFQGSLTNGFLQKHLQNSAESPPHYHLCSGVEILNYLGEQLEDVTCRDQSRLH